MNATPADVPFVWIALLVVSASVFGVVLSVPTAPPPDADRVADAIDEVAATDHAAETVIPIDATAVRIEPTSIALRDSGGSAHASLYFGPVVPAQPDSDLAAVARGTPPDAVYATPAAFEAALDRAQTREHTWRTAGDELRVRRVQFGEVDGVIVG
ncbi:MAG: DUF7283 family protein [Halobacteriota archaeon]